MEQKDIFRKYDNPLHGGALLKPLIAIRGCQCECCKNTMWLNQPINLQVHHKDGDKTNNELDNLQLLCPNCHSYTDNFGSKNRKKIVKISDEEFVATLKKSKSIRQALLLLGLSDASANYDRARKLMNNYHCSLLKEEKIKEKQCPICGKSILPTSKLCEECNKKDARIVEWPAREELKEMIRTKPFTQIADKFKVSDKAVVNWCKRYNLPYRKKDIKLISDEDWKTI